MSTPDMTTHQKGQHGVYPSMDAARLGLITALSREARMPFMVQAHQVLTMSQYRAQAMSLNKLAGKPVATTKKRDYWRDLGRTLYWRTKSLDGGGLLRLEATALDPARVVVHYGFQDRATGARDGVNLTPMTKAIVDGLADVGLAEDDSSLLIPGQDSRLMAAHVPAGQVWVVVTILGGRPLAV